MKRFFLAALCALAACTGLGEANAEENAHLEAFKGLTFRTGKIVLDDGLATLDLSSNFVFLDSADTETFLTKVWSNPPGSGRGTLGALLPRNPHPLSEDGFAAILSYEAMGYVSDEDAEKIDYTALLRDMQEQVRENSKQRVAKGFEPYELLGWAREPYYDKAAKKLYWAKKLRFGDPSSEETLNYEIRILGRRGVLRMNVVAALNALPQIDRQNPELLSMVSFNRGNLYSEFNSSVDTAAAFGIGGLIAGGVLTKTGFLKGLFLMLLASKKLLAALVIGFFAAVWGGVKALFGARKGA